jgi:membrane protein YdbS with pleckstrin-like domain
MKCPACGIEVANNAVYCQNCGERVDMAEGDSPTSEAEPRTPESAESSDPSPQAKEPKTVAERLQESVRSRQNAEDDREDELWKGRYCGKAMMDAWLFCGVITVVLVALGIWFSVNEWLPTGVRWGGIAILLLISWGYPLSLLSYRRMSIRYRLTTQRFFHEEGVLRHTTDRIEVIDMDDITFDQTILERMCNVGTIHITSSDRTHPVLDVIGVADVKNVAAMMDNARRNERIRRGVHIEAV